MCCSLFLFFKQEPAYDMRISDWSSVVCSSDLRSRHAVGERVGREIDGRGRRAVVPLEVGRGVRIDVEQVVIHHRRQHLTGEGGGDRKSAVQGKSVSVGVDLGGRRIITKKNK